MSEAKIANAPTKETSDCSPSFVLGNSFVSATLSVIGAICPV